MSFYTGKHGGKTQCHITKEAHDISSMRGAPFSNTVFHTDIKYVDYVIEPLGASDGSVSYDIRTAYYYYIPTAIKNYISAGYSFFVYDLSTQRYAYEGIIIESSTYRHISQLVQVVDYYTDTVYRQDEDINTQRVYCKKNTSNLVFIFYGIKYDGTKKDLLSQNRNGEIKINKTTFNVGGYNVLTFPYMNPNAINAVDKKIYASDGTFLVQLINETAKNPGLEITINASKTEIKAGGQKVITTEVDSSLIEFGENQITYNLPAYNITVSGGQSNTINHKCSDAVLNTGQVFAMGLYAGKEPAMRIMRYKEGDIQTLERYTLGDESDPGYQHGIVIYGSGGKLYARLHAMQKAGISGSTTYPATARVVSLNILK